MKEPYLTPEIDSYYQLVPSRDGCLGLWGKPIYRGQHNNMPLIFKQHVLYYIGPGDADSAIEIGIELPLSAISMIQEIRSIGLYQWLNNLPRPRTDLLKYEHDFIERWQVKWYRLSVVLLWYRQEADWNVIHDTIIRLIAINEVITLSTR